MAQPTDAFGTTVTAKQFMRSLLKQFTKSSWIMDVTNRDFGTPGDDNARSTKSIKTKNQQFIVTSLLSGGWNPYSGSDLTFTNALEVVSTLVIDQFRSVQDQIMSLSWFKSSIEDPQSGLLQSQGDKLSVILKKYLLQNMYAKAAAGNWIGTSYTTGTVAVAITTGVVTGTGTTFTAAMVGRPFRAAGQSKWYRIKTFTSATSITIENDSDDEVSAYDGGTISAGATFTIQAATAVAITKTNIAAQLIACAVVLDEASYGTNDELIVPTEGRFILLPTPARNPLHAAAEFNKDIEMVYNDTVKQGVIAKVYGMKVIVDKSAFFAGDNTNGYFCIFGHTNFITVGMGFIEPVSIITAAENQTNFGNKYKGLFGFGMKVADPRKMQGGVLFATFA